LLKIKHIRLLVPQIMNPTCYWFYFAYMFFSLCKKFRNSS